MSTARSRAGRALLVVVIGCGIALGAMPRPAAADGYENIPVRRWSVDQIRNLRGGESLLEKQARGQAERHRRWHDVHELVGDRHVSAKSRLLLEQRGFGIGAPRIGETAKAFDGVDTLRVLLVRISFETNRQPGLTTIPADGDFMLDPLADPAPIEIDPPPHDKAFFESHLLGLSEYYRTMSGGRLEIRGRVLPEGDQDSYKVSDIADYGPGADGFWTLQGLENLVRDMIAATDAGTQADGSANLADFDDDDPFTYVIFVHAGSDWQSDINQDSPNDIPTFFVTLGEAAPLSSVDSDGGAGALGECSVIPETTNQDGYPGSIAAAFYHEFGHALGLPDVYNTETGLTSAGIWDLMDSGTNLDATVADITDEGDTVAVLATGVLPPSLSAWSKWYLGWLETDEIDGRTGEYRLPAVGVPRDDYWFWNGFGAFNQDDPQAWRAGVSSREWFLVENRWVPAGSWETPFEGLAFERDEATGVIQYLAGRRDGVWGNSGLYDFFMPAGGVLVWHVNEERIEAELPTNTINAFGDGLRIVEADGIQDVGVLEAYVLGWLGSAFDPFGGYAFDQTGNIIENDLRELYVEGFPSSRLYDRSWSGVRMWDVEPRSPMFHSVMEFKAQIEPLAEGFPWELPAYGSSEIGALLGEEGPRGLDLDTVTPLELDGQPVLVFADRRGETYGDGIFVTHFYALNADGSQRWVQPVGTPERAFMTAGLPPVGAPFARPRLDGGADFVYGDTSGMVKQWQLPPYATPTETWRTDVGDGLALAPLPLTAGVDEYVFCVNDAQVALLLDRAGDPVGDPLALPSTAGGEPLDLRGALVTPAWGGGEAAVLLAADGARVVGLKPGGLDASEVRLEYARTPVDGDLHGAVLTTPVGTWLRIFDADGELGAWLLESGTSLVPVDAEVTVPDGLVAAPAVADLDGDGRDDLVLLTPTRVLAHHADGVPVRGFPRLLRDMFPLSAETRIAGPLVVADGTGDGVNEVFFQTDGGHLLGIGPTGDLLPRLPFRWGDERAAGLAVSGTGADRTLWMCSAGGYVGPPFGRQWTGGRVSGYRLQGPASAGTSEWLGVAGGSLRRGAEGTARDLGSAAPAAVDRSRVVVYPNPVRDSLVTVRFYAAAAGPGRLTVHNLAGEVVMAHTFTTEAGSMQEQTLTLPDLASGLYLTRLEYPGAGGIEIETMTLAVER